MHRESIRKKRLAIVSFTPGGHIQAQGVQAALKEPLGDTYWEAVHFHKPKPLKEWCRQRFEDAEGILFIGAMGIAVRSIAPFLESKTKDPAVLVMDEKGSFLISVLSGHIGGGNELTRLLAGRLGAAAVITTASDVNHKIALDVFAQKNGLYICDMERIKEAEAAILEGKPLHFYCEGQVKGRLPKELSASCEEADIQIRVSPYISYGDAEKEAEASGGRRLREVCLIPKVFVLGVGCRKGKTAQEIEAAVKEELLKRRISMDSLYGAATIDLKQEEEGLLEFCKAFGLPLTCYTARELCEAPGSYEASSFVTSVTGVDNVCERAAVCKVRETAPLKQKEDCLVVPKIKKDGITIALAQREWSVEFE